MATLSRDELTTAVREIVGLIAAKDGLATEFTNADSLSEKVSFDSLTFINFVVQLEERFDIFIDDEELVLEQFDSVERVARLVAGKLEL